jgi:hypothetical protein
MVAWPLLPWMTSSAAIVASPLLPSSSLAQQKRVMSDQVHGAGYSESEVETSAAALELETPVVALELEMDVAPLELDTDMTPPPPQIGDERGSSRIGDGDGCVLRNIEAGAVFGLLAVVKAKAIVDGSTLIQVHLH